MGAALFTANFARAVAPVDPQPAVFFLNLLKFEPVVAGQRRFDPDAAPL
jgi:hypothetical protein